MINGSEWDQHSDFYYIENGIITSQVKMIQNMMTIIY